MLDITITVVCLYDYILHSFSYFQLPNINEIINIGKPPIKYPLSLYL